MIGILTTFRRRVDIQLLGKVQVMGNEPMGGNNEHHRLLKCSQHWSLPGAA